MDEKEFATKKEGFNTLCKYFQIIFIAWSSDPFFKLA